MLADHWPKKNKLEGTGTSDLRTTILAIPLQTPNTGAQRSPKAGNDASILQNLRNRK